MSLRSLEIVKTVSSEQHWIAILEQNRGEKFIQPNAALLRFHKEKCPYLPLDSLQLFYHLLEEINKLKEKREV